MRLDGYTVFITGGAAGIGAACARRYHMEGANVVITDIDDAAGRLLAYELGHRCLYVHADHTDGREIGSAVDQALDAFGALDVLHNNAAMPARGPIEDMQEAMIRRVLDVNLLGPMVATRVALPALLDSAERTGRSSILFTASFQSLRVRPGFTLYGASKHGVAGLLKSLSLELADRGIRVNGLCPGPVDTPLLRDIAAKSGNLEAGLDAFRRDVPMGKLIQSEDVAAAAAFLVSGDARMITGVLLPVDGGLSNKT